MASAVLDIDLADLPAADICLPGFQKAHVLVRFKGLPIGRTWLPLYDGKLSRQEFTHRLLAAVEGTYWQHWMNDFLGWDERKDRVFHPSLATIAICTRNRTKDLKQCLNALINLPDDQQEIIVVDNNPSDDSTKTLVSEFKQVRYVLEPKKGLDCARNRALLEAKHEIVAFIDDDAVPDSNWLRALVANFSSPNVMCVTGLTMPLELETEAQEAFEQYSSFSKGFSRKVFTGTVGNPIATGKIGAGVNMALRKSIVNKVGLFDEALDAGTPTHSGGDHELFARILLAGFHIVYDPAALNWHRHRKTEKELKDVIYGYGVGVYALLTRHLLLSGEFGTIGIATGWFRTSQWRKLKRAMRSRNGSLSSRLILAELKGCLAGPGAYLKSRKRNQVVPSKVR